MKFLVDKILVTEFLGPPDTSVLTFINGTCPPKNGIQYVEAVMGHMLFI